MRIFLSALEHSADLYLADLVRALRKRMPDGDFFGLAGPAAQAAGCRSLRDLTGRAAMLNHAVLRAPEGVATVCGLDRAFSYDPPDVAVLLDSPTFHLPLARRLRNRRIPVFYYIAPQVWAWAGFRVRKIRARVDRVACILPFEEPFLRGRGVEATFVGHPLLDRLRNTPVDQDRLRQMRQAGSPRIALLPGSRRHVIRSLLPDLLYCARRIRQRMPQAAFAVSVARPDVMDLIRDICRKAGLDVPLVHGANAELLTAADLVLVASGTATLEAAYHGKPMIVCYKASPLGYWLVARWLIHVEQLSLVNILAGQRLVPEYMPYYTNPEPIAQEAIELLANEPRQHRIQAGLAEIMASLDRPGVADRVAGMVLDLASQRRLPAARPLGSVGRIW